jgi:VIT1/CCC1 family predicted Fe2+/Mn2+ transporter
MIELIQTHYYISTVIACYALAIIVLGWLIWVSGRD